MKAGRAGTVTHDYKRHGKTTLFAALNTLDGRVSNCDGGDAAVIRIGRDADHLLRTLKAEQSALAVQVQEVLAMVAVLGVRLLFGEKRQEHEAVQPTLVRLGDGANPALLL